MSIKLSEFIKQVRAAKTAAEERAVVAKEAASLRQAFKEGDPTVRHRNAAKLMYMHMLGYPSHFGQMECAKLIATQTYPEKRIGYLCLMVLLDERTEVLMLVTNLMKNDMNQRNQYIAGLALSALGNVGSVEMCRDLAPDVERLLASTNSYLRKKAALCAIRVLHKVPDLAESFVTRSGELLLDHGHGVQLAGCSLLIELCQIHPECIPHFRKYIDALVKILKGLMSQTSMSPEHLIDGVQDPFLQVRALQLLRILGKGDAEASDRMSDILAQVATNTEATKTSSNAILYECVQTIMGVEAMGGLRTMAINILGKFLSNKDNNMRYVALNTLARVVAVDAAAVARHRNTIVECVRDADISIRRRALDLIYGLVNRTNIETLARELLDYLAQSDKEFKGDLTTRLCQLISKFAPSKRWHIDTMCQILQQAGPFVKDDICRGFIVLVTNAPEMVGYAARSLYRILVPVAAQPSLAFSLASTAIWCTGEFGDLMLDPSDLLPGEAAFKATANDILSVIETVVTNPAASADLQGYCLTALVKLSTRMAVDEARIQRILARLATSVQLELQQRSCEYLKLFEYEDLRLQLVDRMPPLDESAYAALTTGAVAEGAAAAGDADSTRRDAQQLAALLQMDLQETAPSPSTPAASTPQRAAPAAAAAAAQQQQQQQQVAAAAAPAGPPAPKAPAADRTAIVLKGPDVAVGFQVRQDPSHAAVVHVRAAVSAVNSATASFSNVQLQVAVPKYCTLKMDPPSGDRLAVGEGPVLQVFHLSNSTPQEKPTMVRLRVIYTTAEGEEKAEQVSVGADVLQFYY